MEIEIREEWFEIRDKVARIHPEMEKELRSLDENIAKAHAAAAECDAIGVGFGIAAGKIAVELPNRVEHLEAAKLIDEETCSQFKKELQIYCTSNFEGIFMKFTACAGKAEAEIMAAFIRQAYELDPKLQELLVKYARQVRNTEKKG